MREIKFRGKTTDNVGDKKIWIYGDLLQGCEICDICEISDCESIDGTRYQVDENSIGQYTGLKDKNGKEIYEGDVVICREFVGGQQCEYHIERGYVEFLNGAFGLHRKQGYYRPFKDWFDNYEIEVIGNIYENPELVEEE